MRSKWFHRMAIVAFSLGKTVCWILQIGETILFAKRQFNRELATLVFNTFNKDLAAMSFDQCFGNCQTESSTSSHFSMLVNAPKSLKNVGEFLSRNAITSIDDLDNRDILFGTHFYLNMLPFRRVFYGVGNQIVKDALYLIFIGQKVD